MQMFGGCFGMQADVDAPTVHWLGQDLIWALEKSLPFTVGQRAKSS